MAQSRLLGHAAKGAIVVAIVLVIWLVASEVSHDPGGRATEPAAGPAGDATAQGLPGFGAGQLGTGQSPAVERAVQELDERRLALDQTVWKQEVLAQSYEEVFVDLWDTLRSAKDQLAVLAEFPFATLSIGQQVRRESHDWGIEGTVFGEPNRTLNRQDVLKKINALRSAGFEIVESEWHHAAFDQTDDGNAESTISMTLHVINTSEQRRLIVRGKLHVSWLPQSRAGDPPMPGAIVVADLKILARQGKPAFEEVFTLGPNPQSSRPNDVEPLLLYDLDRNGLSEIILAGANQIYWNQTGGKFERSPLCRHPLGRVDAAIIAEFTGDSFPDLLVAGGGHFPRLYIGAPGRVFEKARTISLTGSPLVAPSVITAGDVDGDGDLDVWIGQYKRPYVQGQMPTPFYDANDGFPSYLLINDGTGGFTDQTEAAGLGGKRWRRTYGSSFFDFDDDGDLDLIVTNDFAGVDLYYNDGRGRFEDVTDATLRETRTFGMSHTFGDYDLDGGMDVLVVGMSSTTARRLEAMGLGRDEYPEIQAMRMRMGYGNRMYLGGKKGLAVAPFNDDIARTGWSWGSTSFDFDLDGDLDLYIANGHSSGKSSKDYCTTFWRHDIYSDPAEGSEENAARNALFKQSLFVVDHGEESWNGYEHNALFMNEAGGGFLQIGFLMGVGLEHDSRSVVSDDVDGDGRPDLLVVTQTAQPESRDTLRVLRNTLINDNNWIGVRLYDSGPGKSPQGADVAIYYNGTSQHQRMVTGDSYRAQHAAVALFGIGQAEKIDKLVVRWAGGLVTEKLNPVTRRYHLISLDGSQNSSQSGHNRMLEVLRKIAKRTPDENLYLGDRALRDQKAELAGAGHSLSPQELRSLYGRIALGELRQGNTRSAIDYLKRAHESVTNLDSDPQSVTTVLFYLGLSYMRMGETENCCLRHTAESCIVPIKPGGQHSRREGSTNAIRYFESVLARLDVDSPMYWKSRWLLNIAHMTLGSYPDAVPANYLISPKTFESEIEFPRFRNIGPQLGLDTFNLSGGAIVDDFDGDDYLDVFVSTFDTSGQLHFFRNNGDGTFSDRTEAAGLAGLYGGLNIEQADFDNDGWLDVLVLRGGWLGMGGRHPNSLLRNNGDGTFRDVTFEAGLAEPAYPTQTGAWADFNNDGLLDLYLGNETTGGVEAPSQLFVNNGNGTFTDVAAEAGVQNMRFTKGVTWGDYDADGLMDLYVSNLGAANRLYHNNGDGTFTDVASEAGVEQPSRSFPTWFWDFDNDGNLDIFVGSYTGYVDKLAAYLAGHKSDFELPGLFRGDGKGGFEDVARLQGLVEPMLPMGANFGDLNNDGFLDFYLGTGAPGYEQLMPNRMYLNREGRKFTDVTMAGGFGHLQKGHGVVFADLDNDGDLDVYEQMGGALRGDKYVDALYDNPGFGNHSITLKLVGVESNRSAIGARLRVDFVDAGVKRSVYRQVNSGGSFGANPLRQTIGVGKALEIATLEITWPGSGLVQTLHHLAVDRTIEIREGQGTPKQLNLRTYRFGESSH